MMRKYFLSLALACGVVVATQAQEFNCNVNINDDKAQSVDTRVFVEMKRSIIDFMNLRRWTTDTYSNEERISCNILITITEVVGVGKYKATAQIQSARPVYGSGYETMVLNYLDQDWAFQYTEGQPMEFNENTFTNDLTSLLAFYAYVMLGYDADTFSKLGGKQYYNKAQVIMANAAQGTSKGWQAFDGTKCRYWLLENMLNQQVTPYREGLYNYYRLGLDTYLQNPEQSRTVILDVLNKIKVVNTQKPSCLVLNNFFDAKANELINVFSDGAPQEKQSAYNILSQLDPTKTEKYQKLIK